MFDFQKDYRFAWPVKVLVPTLEGQKECEFTGIFRLVPEEELRDAHAANPNSVDTQTARLSLVGWKDDLVMDGKPLQYSEVQRDELIAVPFARYAIAMAYWSAIGGALRLKN